MVEWLISIFGWKYYKAQLIVLIICMYRVHSIQNNGILLPKLFWPTMRKSCSSDQEWVLKFEAEGRKFEKVLRSLEQFIQTVKGQNNFW